MEEGLWPRFHLVISRRPSSARPVKFFEEDSVANLTGVVRPPSSALFVHPPSEAVVHRPSVSFSYQVFFLPIHNSKIHH